MKGAETERIGKRREKWREGERRREGRGEYLWRIIYQLFDEQLYVGNI